MKTISRLLILILLLGMLCGCDLQNRRPSSEFIPVTQPTESTAPPETEPVEPSTQAPTAPREFNVRDIFSQHGKYTDVDGRSYSYSYLLPLADADTEYAAACNNEIDRNYRSVVNEQLALMESYKPLTVLRIDYETYLIGDVLTLYVTQRGVDASEDSYSVYSFDKTTGKEAAHESLLKLGGFEDEESFLTQTALALQEEFEKQYGDQQYELGYEDALDRTLREDNYSVDMPMHLDKKGQLVIVATIYDLARQGHPTMLTVLPPEAAPEE